MAKDVWFFVKVFIAATFVAVLLQVKIGEEKLESKFQTWVESSFVVDQLQYVVDGGVTLAVDGYDQLNKVLSSGLNRLGRDAEKKKDRGIDSLKMERNKAVENLHDSADKIIEKAVPQPRPSREI